jgi:dynein heavy chain 1
MMIVELKSDALKERHWKLLMKQLRVNWVLSDLTLGQVWDVNLQKNEAIVKDIILVAQGEMALEEFLKQVCVTCVQFLFQDDAFLNFCGSLIFQVLIVE